MGRTCLGNPAWKQHCENTPLRETDDNKRRWCEISPIASSLCQSTFVVFRDSFRVPEWSIKFCAWKTKRTDGNRRAHDVWTIRTSPSYANTTSASASAKYVEIKFVVVGRSDDYREGGKRPPSLAVRTVIRALLGLMGTPFAWRPLHAISDLATKVEQWSPVHARQYN